MALAKVIFHVEVDRFHLFQTRVILEEVGTSRDDLDIALGVAAFGVDPIQCWCVPVVLHRDTTLAYRSKNRDTQNWAYFWDLNILDRQVAFQATILSSIACVVKQLPPWINADVFLITADLTAGRTFNPVDVSTCFSCI